MARVDTASIFGFGESKDVMVLCDLYSSEERYIYPDVQYDQRIADTIERHKDKVLVAITSGYQRGWPDKLIKKYGFKEIFTFANPVHGGNTLRAFLRESL